MGTNANPERTNTIRVHLQHPPLQVVSQYCDGVAGRVVQRSVCQRCGAVPGVCDVSASQGPTSAASFYPAPNIKCYVRCLCNFAIPYHIKQPFRLLKLFIKNVTATDK